MGIYVTILKLQILPFSNAFYRGLSDLISPSWLKLFNASEFNQVSSFLSVLKRFCLSLLFFFLLSCTKSKGTYFCDRILHFLKFSAVSVMK